MNFPKPKILVSKCLEFDNCRYNGMRLNSPLVYHLKDYVDFVPVCPEVAIWLGTPRTPIRMINIDKQLRLREIWTERDLTDDMNQFSHEFLEKIDQLDGAIFKWRSPSCAIFDSKVHNGTSGLEKIQNLKAGFFAKALFHYFPYIPKEDDGRVLNFRLREEFLTKIFLHARFREVYASNKISDFIDFQAQNKYLFMSYSQSELKILGNILWNYDKTNLEEIKQEYKKVFQLMLIEKRTHKNMRNTFEHIFWYFKKYLSAWEKKYFLDTLEMFMEERIPTSVIIHMLKSWAIAHNIEYVLKQSILEPYPEELIDLSDAGKKLYL